MIRRGLHPDGNGNILLAICLFVFMSSPGSGIASPIIPLYARSLGASYIQIGIIGTAYGLVYAIGAAPLGRLPYKLDRKIIMVASTALRTLAAANYHSPSMTFLIFFTSFISSSNSDTSS